MPETVAAPTPSKAVAEARGPDAPIATGSDVPGPANGQTELSRALAYALHPVRHGPQATPATPLPGQERTQDRSLIVDGAAGSPLREQERSRFQPLLARSLAGVRVHEGPGAQASAAALGARAWAVADHIVLGGGITESERPSVLAHELVHALAQRAASPEPRPYTVGGEHDPVEQETETAASRLLWGRPVSVKPDPGNTLRQLPPGQQGEPLVLRATSFQDAADQMRGILDELGEEDRFRLVVVGATSLSVFDRQGQSLGTFRLRVPAVAASGVHVQVGGELQLRQLVRRGNGYVPGGLSAGNLDFRTDVDRKEVYSELIRGFVPVYVIPAAARTRAPDTTPAPPEEPDPLLQFRARNRANLPAWQGAVVPLTPQITAADTIGSFMMRVENNLGATMLDRVTNLMQPINYNWEVLKLDESFRPMEGGGRRATRLDAAAAHFERRQRDLAADRRTLLGEHPQRQSLPERVVRTAITEQMHQTRAILAMTGETVMTFLRAVAGGPDNPFSEDIIDVPFRQPGDYFVRCLATPVSRDTDPYRRATTVAGVTVSVFDIEELTREALGTQASDEERARQRVAEIDATLAAPPDESDTSPGATARRARDRAFLGFERTYRQALADAGGDQLPVLQAERAWVQARIAWLSSGEAPAGDEAFQQQKQQLLERLRGENERLTGILDRSTGRLGNVARTGIMRALLVDESVGGRIDLTFSFGERTYVATTRTEVIIADVTAGEGGRVFSGTGDGRGSRARNDAVRAAMRDLRQNLHRGRGYLAYRMPPVYRSIDLDLPNPMQLQMSALDQLVETADDAAHAATLAALVAAPFTGGASLQILAVLAPIQAGTSLYRIVNRSMYQDLSLDAQAISDFINIASFGLGGAGGVSRFASRGVQIAASTRNVAVLLLDAGNYVVMGWEAFRELTAPDTGQDPREGRRRRLMALLTMLEGASIPVATHLWPPGGHPPRPTEPPARTGPVPEPVPHPGEPRPAGPEPSREEGTPETRAPGEATPAAHPAVEGRLTDVPALRRGLPTDLAGSLPIVRDTSPDFGTTTVRVEYTVDTRGVITDIQLRVGRDVSFRHIAEHVRTIRSMQRYQGFSGRVRVLIDRVVAWLTLHPDAGPGTRAWEARLELEKLRPIVEARAREMADPATSATRRAELDREIAHLEAQLADHAAALEGLTTQPSRGYVAAEGLSAGAAEAARRQYPSLPDASLHASDGTSMGEYIWRFRRGDLEVINRGEGRKLLFDETTRAFHPDTGAPRAEPRFVEGATRAEAYAALGGREPTSEFGRFTEMLLREGIVPDHDTLVANVQEPGDRTYRTVRSNLKDLYAARIVQHLTDPVRLAATPVYNTTRRQGRSHADALNAASHAEMVRMTRELYVSDRGAIAERWYEARFGLVDSPTPTQVSITQAEAAAMGVALTADRRFDRVSGNMIEELKNVRTGLDAGDRAEINDQLQLVGHDLNVGGRVHSIDYVKVSILDPEGVLANAAYMYRRLDPGAPNSESLIFELHSSLGDTLSVTTDNRAILNNPVVLRQWIRTGRLP